MKQLGSALLTAVLAVAAGGSAGAETYVGGHVGVNSGRFGDNVSTDSTLPAGTAFSNLSLKSSPVFGAKVGHYLNVLPWLGVEAEAFYSRPSINQQSVTVTAPGFGSGTGVLPEQGGSVWTTAFNLVVRYPDTRVQPYAGVGVAIVRAKYGDQSDTAPGLNALAGLRVKITDAVGVFAEYKFTHADLRFEETVTSVGFDTTYQSHAGVAGVSLHF